MGRRFGVAAIVVTAALVSGCALLGARSSHGNWAYGEPDAWPEPGAADWTAEPTGADQALVEDAIRACLDMAGDTALGGSEPIVDQRGSAAALLWADRDETVHCLVSRRDDGGIGIHALGGSMSAAGQLTVTDVACGSPTVVVGSAPAGTQRLVIETHAGREVTASLRDERFIAWWPGRDDPVALLTETSIADLAARWC